MFDKHESAAWRWVARRLVRLGLWAQRRRATVAYRRGEVSEVELQVRLAAYREVAAL